MRQIARNIREAHERSLLEYERRFASLIEHAAQSDPDAILSIAEARHARQFNGFQLSPKISDRPQLL